MAECASGAFHSLFLDPLGCVWSCGFNENGQLGLGNNNKSIPTPQKINNLPPIISVSAANSSSFFLDENGSVWSCGRNHKGQLGLGDEVDRNVPEQITNLPKIISTIALCYSAFFLDVEGTVWACGDNQYGNLGLGDMRNRTKPTPIRRGIPKIKSMAGGQDHALFLDFEGAVWGCGINSQGNLGLGDAVHRYTVEKIRGLPVIKSIAGGAQWSMFVDEQGDVWVCGGNFYGELGLGHTNRINLPQKNNNLSGIVAIGGGYEYYSVFLDNAGNIYTCGRNGYGQLGLGDTEDRHTPQKVKFIPPMSSLSSCNAACEYLQIVDEEGRVWSCGANGQGQLGLGFKRQIHTFMRSQMVVKLKPKEGAERKLHEEETEMFKSIEKEQNKQLMDKVKSSKHLHNVNKQQAKQKITEGVIGMADWSSKWKDIHAKNQQLNQSIEQHKVNLNTKQQQLDKLMQEVNEIKQALSNMEEQKEVVDFFDILLEPIAEAEKELKSGFEEKLKEGKHGEWTVDETSLFLNVCGMENLVFHQRQKQIDGKVLTEAISDVTAMEIKDKLTEKKMVFYLKVLESGKMMNEQELSQNMVWRHREVEKTLLLMKEWDIVLDEDLVRKKGISICELLYFEACDFKKELGMDESLEIAEKLKRARSDFENFLANK